MTPDQYRREGAEAMQKAAADHCWSKRDLLADAEKRQIDVGLSGRDYYGRRLEAELLSRAIRAIDVDEVLAGMPPAPEAEAVTMTYRNWRGEVGKRTIVPIRVWFGATEWHPKPGWLLSALDLEKGAARDFALVDCQFSDLAPAPDAVARLVEADTPRAWTDVLDERKRQVAVEGWTPEHDDEHDEGELAAAAGSYAINPACMLSPYDGVPRDELPDTWPPEWDVKWWKPSPDNPRRDLVKAGALILAEIERLDRAALAAMETSHD